MAWQLYQNVCGVMAMYANSISTSHNNFYVLFNAGTIQLNAPLP